MTTNEEAPQLSKQDAKLIKLVAKYYADIKYQDESDREISDGQIENVIRLLRKHDMEDEFDGMINKYYKRLKKKST